MALLMIATSDQYKQESTISRLWTLALSYRLYQEFIVIILSLAPIMLSTSP